MNITNTIWRNCNAHPSRVAIVYDGQAVNYGALRAAAERASARLAAAGIARGDVVALSINGRLAYLVVLLALARLGAAGTPVSRGLSERQREELVTGARAHSIVLDQGDGWRSSNLPAARYFEAATLLAPEADGERLDVPPVVQGLDEEPWLIALSSGTTGKPKRSPQPHGRGTMLVSISPLGNQDDEGRIYVFGSLGIEYAITAVMRQLYRGETVVLTQTSRPEAFFASVERDQPTRVVTTTGNASSLVAYAAKSLAESPKICAGIKSIMVAGSFVSPVLREGIVNRICPRLEVDYGSTETGSLALSTPETHALRPKSVGRLNAWVHAEAVDENDKPLPPGESGLLRFKSPLLTKGYLDDEETTALAFRNGWFYPGDTGSVGVAGYLFLRGRVDHVINLGGNKIDLRLIEQVLDDQPEIVESAVVPVNRGAGVQVLVAVVEARAPFDSEALKRLCQERLGVVYVPDAIVKVEALPRNESGKVRRRALAASIKFSDEKAAPEEQG